MRKFSPFMLQSNKLLLSFLSGLLIFLSFPPADLYFLAWVALVPLFFACRGANWKAIFCYGWIGGIVINAGGFYWLIYLLLNHGHLHVAAALPIFILFCLAHSLPFGIWICLAHWLSQRFNRLAIGIYPLTFVAIEFLSPQIFPWQIGASQYLFYTIAQLADITSVCGISFLIVLSNFTIFRLADTYLAQKNNPGKLYLNQLIFPVVILTTTLIYGQVRMVQWKNRIQTETNRLKVGVVQSNIGIQEGKKDRQENMYIHYQMSKKLENNGAQLVIWPESSYEYSIDRRLQPGKDHLFPSKIPLGATLKEEKKIPLRRLDAIAPQRGFTAPLIFGALSYKQFSQQKEHLRNYQVYNSAFLIDSKGMIKGRYDKNFLLIFGEYIPLVHHFPFLVKKLNKWFGFLGGFNRGDDPQLFLFDKAKLGIIICYEDILPAYVNRYNLSSTQKPNLLVNITNDAWFGDTSEPYLHLAVATFRTIEQRLYMVRAVNTGISAFIDPLGRIYAKSPGHQRDALLEEVKLLNSTTVYSLLGDWFAYLSILFTVVLLLYCLRPGRRI